jgi:hypothetical protein
VCVFFFPFLQHNPDLCLCVACVCNVIAVQALLKHFEARRRVVYIDEYNTSQFCPNPACLVRLEPVSSREKRCPECKRVWNRDEVGGKNQRLAFDHCLAHNGERPPHLRRPDGKDKAKGKAAQPAKPAAGKKSKPSRKRAAPSPSPDGRSGATTSGAPPAAQRAKVGLRVCAYIQCVA